MLDAPMARRQRGRTRARRAQEASSRHVAPVRTDAGAARAAPHRPTRISRTGYARALGQPSPSLERAAVLERGYIVKDFRRLAIVVAIALVMLLVAGFLESALLK